MAFFEHILLYILENKRAKKFENSAKCAYKPIFSYSIKNSISSKMSLTTFLHSADELFILSATKLVAHHYFIICEHVSIKFVMIALKMSGKIFLIRVIEQNRF